MTLTETATATEPSDDPASGWAEAAEARLLHAAIGLAPLLGWSERLMLAAAREVGLSPADAELLAPAGARDLAALLSRAHDGRRWPNCPRPIPCR